MLIKHLLSSGRMCIRAIGVVMLVPLLARAQSLTDSSWKDNSDREVYWEAFTSLNINDKNLPRLPSTKQVLILKVGWSCEITPTSVNEARKVTCTKGAESVSASVMCDLNRPEDHVQLQFVSGKGSDLLHLGCEFAAYRDWRRRKTNEHQERLGIGVER